MICFFKDPLRLILCIFLILSLDGCESRFPSVRTIDVINISTTSAQSGGLVTDEGSGAVVARGLIWKKTGIPTLGSLDGITSEGTGSGIFTSIMNGLSPSAEYKVRAFASNEAGTSYGFVLSFTTLSSGNNNNNNSTPEITTTTPEVVADESAKLGGKLISDGGSYITEKGVYWGASQNPEITGAKVKAGSGSERFTVTVNVLTPNTKYYVKAYIINSLGEFRGMQVSFKTNLYLAGDIAFNNNLSYGSVTDIEGNIYKTVRIGTQTWMAENLKTTLYNDGTPIPNVTDNSAWITIVTPAYCWHNNMIENKNLIGAHYNWYAVNTGKLCPAGWHVPSDNEWKTFTDYLGGLDVTGGKIKETGLVHWEEPNIGATNSSGFTALPAGQRRGDDGTFTGLGLYDGWWSSTEYNSIKSWYRSIATINTEVFRSSGSVNQTGISIRCIKD